MPRRKVALEKIENRATMQVTFSKRRKGLFKKANELAIMCSAQVLVIVFSAASKVTHYANPSVDEILERWNTYLGTNQAPENPSVDLSTKEEIDRLRKDVDERDLIISQLKGENLDNLSIDQLKILSELTQKGLNRQKEKERELYKKKIAELQHPSHLPSGTNVRQKQETGARNVVVHQEKMLPKSVLTTNSNCENALHDEGDQMKIVELRHTKNLIEEIGRQKKEAARAENVAYQESMSSKLIVTPNSNSEDALHNLCLKL